MIIHVVIKNCQNLVVKISLSYDVASIISLFFGKYNILTNIFLALTNYLFR